ncbi:hypothetical protein R9C00_11040 [Flammeovirgaceae bacterium SG7u.111]|nr:hypothetical protein [Flammeovirgaceae bacterium SG7u.132]WPO37986.1 hypothetical protein R9C00_11040 [Flammeovirgaceae bacterium SG7u.111]
MENREFLSTILMNPVLLAKANNAGYTKKELEEGLAMADRFKETNYRWDELQAEKSKRYDVYHEAMKTLETVYTQHIAKARNIFDEEEEKSIWKSLNLQGKRPDDISGIMDYITKFYSFAQKDKVISDRFKKRNVSSELVAQMLLLAEEAATLRIEALHAANLAKASTADRDIQKAEFHSWLKAFKAIYKATPDGQVSVNASSKVKSEKAKIS